MVFRAFRLSRDQLPIGQPPSRLVEKGVDALPFFHFAAVPAPRKFIQIPLDMSLRNPMMNADHLTLEVRPRSFDPVGMDVEPPHVFTGGMVDRAVAVGFPNATVAAMLVGHDDGAGGNVRAISP